MSEGYTITVKIRLGQQRVAQGSPWRGLTLRPQDIDLLLWTVITSSTTYYDNMVCLMVNFVLCKAAQIEPCFGESSWKHKMAVLCGAVLAG